MTASLQTPFVKQVHTAVDGFELVRRLAQHADDGVSRIVTVRTRLIEATGLTVGVVEYLERHGIPADNVRADHSHGGHRAEPEHLHLVDAVVRRPGGEDVIRPALRVRIVEVNTCWF